ncbi:MAG: hypothetical protein J1G07_05840 [Clostridiales bacterium]|nr:hypothetical protein [Clostridiales bacterium]
MRQRNRAQTYRDVLQVRVLPYSRHLTPQNLVLFYSRVANLDKRYIQ